MDSRTRLSRNYFGVVAAAWIAAGCAVPSATLQPTLAGDIAPTESATAEATAAGVPHPSWTTLSDPVYGYSIVVPCWWWVTPTPAGGVSGVMTLHSYDEAYFQANSTKGWWAAGDFPPGAFKVDIGGWPVDDPTASTYDAALAAFTSDEQEVTSAEETTIGRNPAIDLQTRSTANPDNLGRLIVFRLRPETLLFVSGAPLSAFDSPDVQGVLESLALTPGETAAIPTFAPSQPLIEVPAGCTAP